MTALWHIFRLILRDQRAPLLRGAALSLLVLAMGAALLGLSGWFITAAAAAGLAGLGAVFDVFRPSAMVRLLALGRAAARYGERLLTHDATLRALESLRLRLLASQLTAPFSQMIRIRGAQALNRLTADIDALDGVTLRLMLPIAAGLGTQILAFAFLWVLVAPAVALWVLGGYMVGSLAIFLWMARISTPLSRRASQAGQAFRTRLIDMIRARRDLAVYGQLVAQNQSVMRAEDRRFDLRRLLDRAERRAGAGLSILGTFVAAGALGIGITLAQAGSITPAQAAIGFFVALALGETIAPLRRAIADLGQMADAARRVWRDLATDTPQEKPGQAEGATLHIANLGLCRMGTTQRIVDALDATLLPGETVAITGASGAGKSTILLACAGLLPIAAGQIHLGGQQISEWNENALRKALTLIPQRSSLMAGTVADALRLAAPQASESDLWRVLDAVQLSAVVQSKGGLSAAIGPRGDGLSGGEGRRLALARGILRGPKVLLLDEPTEGLDDITARAVLIGIRNELPKAAILIAAHRDVETSFADRLIHLK